MEPPGVNERGELPGAGPEWACRDFGAPDHDYLTCSACRDWYHIYLMAKTGVQAAA